MSDRFSALEQAVIDKMLFGEHPALAVLRSQAEHARVVERKETGVGFYCDIAVRSDSPLLEGDFEISDVHGSLSGLCNGVAFVLFVREGRLSMLEGVTFGESWPQSVGSFELGYDQEPRKLQLPGHSG